MYSVFCITLWDLESKENQSEHEVHAGYCVMTHNNILCPWPRSFMSFSRICEPVADSFVSLQIEWKSQTLYFWTPRGKLGGDLHAHSQWETLWRATPLWEQRKEGWAEGEVNLLNCSAATSLSQSYEQFWSQDGLSELFPVGDRGLGLELFAWTSLCIHAAPRNGDWPWVSQPS